MADVAHRNAFERLADFVGVRVIRREDLEATLSEAAVLSERGTDLSRADDDDLPLPAKPEDLTQAPRKLGNGVTQPPFAERSEEGEVLSDLG